MARPDAAAATTEAPLIRVLRGAPQDDELAAVVAVLTAVMAPAAQLRPSRPATSRWRTQARSGWAGPRSWTSARSSTPTTHSRRAA